MTNEEIDKWVEDHIVVPPDDEISEAKRPIYADIVPPIIEWGKMVARKFYELGKKEGVKVVDYTAAFEVERKHRDNELPRYYGD